MTGRGSFLNAAASPSFPLLCVLSLFLLRAAIRWKPSVEAPPVKNTVIKLPQEKNQAVEVPGDFDWDKLSRDDLGQLSSYFGHEEGAHRLDWKSSVSLGQTVITGVYEGKSGEFILSRLTPELNKDGDPRCPIRFKVSTRTFDLAGQQGKVADYDLPMFSINGHLESGMLVGTPDGDHMLSITAKPNSNGSSFSIQTSGGYTKRLPSTGPAE